MSRRAASPQALPPRTAILANDSLSVMLTDAGSGYSHWRGQAVTRWREDTTRDPWGSYICLRDAQSGAVWSPTGQPFGADAGLCTSELHEHVARFARRDGALTTTLEVAIAPQYPLEVRGIGLRNEGDAPRDIELTSYAELVLGDAHSDASHPAFSKMFVQTQFDASSGALLATRRKREASDPDIWASHAVVVDGRAVGGLQYETDRVRWLGRDRTPRNPAALDAGAKLSGSVGTVLDPIFSLRVRVHVPAHSTRRIAFVTAAAASRHGVLALIKRHSSAQACAKVFTRAAQRLPEVLRKFGIDAEQARRCQRLAGALLYNDPALRAAPDILVKGEGGAPVLWAKGISGDLPIALLCINNVSQLPLVEDLLRVQRYWRAKHLPADLVIVNDGDKKSVDALQNKLEAAAGASGKQPEQPEGRVFVLHGDEIDARLRYGLLTAARIVLHGKNGDLKKQIRRLHTAKHLPVERAKHPTTTAATHWKQQNESSAALQNFNGTGGFSVDGSEYVTLLRDGVNTPMPWSQIVANPDFGFLATATGGGYCWALNSQQNQITPWSNDAAVDPPSEVLYLRNLDDGALWSATASPIRIDSATYTARFGPGYARFETAAHGIESELTQFVPVADSLKISRLHLRNRSARKRRLSITAYVEWALGAIGTNATPFGITSFDQRSDALLAQNRWREEFGERVAFAAFDKKPLSYTGDRCEFLGRNGALNAPAALNHAQPLSGRTSAGFDACAALQTIIELAPDAETEIVFLLGEEADANKACASVERYRATDLDAVFAQVQKQWDDALDTVQVRTPDAGMDLLLNRCLLYQTLACRLWARTAFYQASGAYGFRDQLQDVMALCVARPDLARGQILRAAGRQFVEGDVQHWWLPPSGKGVRTRVTDDRLWLPYVVAHYLETTGDHGVLDASIPFLQGDVLKPGQNDSFFLPSEAEQGGTLFEHCARAIEVSLAFGSHGLPLMGTGDWNDGMNRVGIGGKGESVWLGWFLYAVLDALAPIAEQRGETQRAIDWRAHARHLREALNHEAWDGGWYKRAWYDDGTPLGSKRDTECRIDSIAQSWSVISGGGDDDAATQAMRAVDEQLVRANDGLVALFTAPFDKTHHDPGYIKAYPPGIRENGGQYTHGSIWSAIAFAMLGDGDKAHELFHIFDPLGHTATPAGVQRYKVEPYVVCADVYSVGPHIGRGGWTWYSGSAGWLYRAGLETLLGFRLRGAGLRIDPCIPRAWPGFQIEFRYHSARYTITVENPKGVCRGVARVELDGSMLKDASATIPLADDSVSHNIRVVMGENS